MGAAAVPSAADAHLSTLPLLRNDSCGSCSSAPRLGATSAHPQPLKYTTSPGPPTVRDAVAQMLLQTRRPPVARKHVAATQLSGAVVKASANRHAGKPPHGAGQAWPTAM